MLKYTWAAVNLPGWPYQVTSTGNTDPALTGV